VFKLLLTREVPTDPTPSEKGTMQPISLGDRKRATRWHRGQCLPAGAVAPIALVLGLLLSSCHSSASPTSAPEPTDAFTTYGTSPQADTTSPIDTGSPTTGDSSTNPLTHVGRLTVTTTGSSVTTDLSVAPATPSTAAQPPADVMAACNWSYAPTLAQSVFIHGSVTIQYNGKLPEEVTIASPSLIDLKTGFLLDFGVALQGTDGSWGNCGGFGTTLQPGQTVTTEMWIDYKLLSNTHPTFSPADVEGLALQSGAVDADQAGPGYGNTTTASNGPGAANCGVEGGDPKATLLLYGAPPFSYTAQNETGTQLRGSCSTP